MVKKENKFKSHLKKHKVKYLVGSSLVAVGGLGFYVGYNCKVSKVVDNSKDMIIGNVVGKDIKVEQIDNSVNNFITNVSRKGHAGNVIYCPELDTWYSSQGDAERSCKLPRGTVSKIVNGVKDRTSDGLTFKRLATFNSEVPKVVKDSQE